MKRIYSGGSNEMYADHEAMETKSTSKKTLRIANCRGKKPVLRDIKKARDILSNLLIEINSCEGERAIKKCTSLLWDVLKDNE